MGPLSGPSHPCIPLLPVIQGGFADPELPAHFQSLGPSFDLLKRVDKPFLAVSFPWHFLSFLREPPTIRKLKFPPSSFRIQGQKERAEHEEESIQRGTDHWDIARSGGGSPIKAVCAAHNISTQIHILKELNAKKW